MSATFWLVPAPGSPPISAVNWASIQRVLTEAHPAQSVSLDGDPPLAIAVQPREPGTEIAPALLARVGELAGTTLRVQSRPIVGSPGAGEGRWTVWRQDDNGNRYEMSAHDTQAQAEEVAAAMEARGHKQMYWVERSSTTPGSLYGAPPSAR